MNSYLVFRVRVARLYATRNLYPTSIIRGPTGSYVHTPLQRIYFRIQLFRRAYRILIARYFQLNVLRHRFLRLRKLLSMIIIIIRAPIGRRPSIPRVVVRYSQLLILHRVVSPVGRRFTYGNFSSDVSIGLVRLAGHFGNLPVIIGHLKALILYFLFLSGFLRYFRRAGYIHRNALLGRSLRDYFLRSGYFLTVSGVKEDFPRDDRVFTRGLDILFLFFEDRSIARISFWYRRGEAPERRGPRLSN